MGMAMKEKEETFPYSEMGGDDIAKVGRILKDTEDRLRECKAVDIDPAHLKIYRQRFSDAKSVHQAIGALGQLIDGIEVRTGCITRSREAEGLLATATLALQSMKAFKERKKGADLSWKEKIDKGIALMAKETAEFNKDMQEKQEKVIEKKRKERDPTFSIKEPPITLDPYAKGLLKGREMGFRDGYHKAKEEKRKDSEKHNFQKGFQEGVKHTKSESRHEYQESVRTFQKRVFEIEGLLCELSDHAKRCKWKAQTLAEFHDWDDVRQESRVHCKQFRIWRRLLGFRKSTHYVDERGNTLSLHDSNEKPSATEGVIPAEAKK